VLTSLFDKSRAGQRYLLFFENDGLGFYGHGCEARRERLLKEASIHRGRKIAANAFSKKPHVPLERSMDKPKLVGNCQFSKARMY